MMKKFFSALLTFLLIITLVSCGNSEFEKADKLAIDFITALILRDNDAMLENIHPDYTETALPNDEFYETLQTEHFFVIGKSLTALDSIAKNNIDDTSVDGELLQCVYVARTNELFYTIELIILENDKGYGVIAVSAALNTNVDYYDGTSAENG